MRKFFLSLLMMLMSVSTSVFALDKVDGVYQIGSAADFAEFAALVNGGQKSANAILTADIDLGTDIDTYKLYDGEYNGTFDGAGHTITINFSDGTKDNQGPAIFRSIGNRALIKRLKVQGTITTSKQHAAAITNYSGGVIRDCWADVTIKCSTAMTDASAAAFVGQCNKNSLIENSVAKIAIDAVGSGRFGGVAAWADADRCHIANCLVINDNCNFDRSDGKSAGLVRNDAKLVVVDLATYNADSYHNRPAGAVANNYVVDDFGGPNKGTTVITTADIESGKICFQLNSDQKQIRWKQNLGTDPYPVPAVFRSEGQVYASASTNCQGKADGEVTFSNTPSNAIATAHTYDKYGVCTTCGQFNWNSFDFNDPERYDPADRSFLINSGDDLFLAEGWNRLQNGCKFNLKLVNDVTCTPPAGQLIFNNSDWSECSFNGQGHELTIEMVDIPDQNPAFLPKPYAYTGDFVFENVIMHGKITSTYTGAAPFAGSVCSREYGGNRKIIRNVFSDIDISVSRAGDNTTGGLLGVADGVVSIENSIYAGELAGVEGAECIAGLCGWTSGGNTSLTNCAFTGTITNGGGDSHTIARNYANSVFKNVYSVNAYGSGDEAKYTKVTAEAAANGELAYLLNGKENAVERFYQLIGTDEFPIPVAKEGALIYATAPQYRCDGQPIGEITYSNHLTGLIPPHRFDDGVCKNCGELEKDADGYMKIISAKSLAQFSNLVNSGKTALKVRMYEDVDMSGTEYTSAGSPSNIFTGEFDGQGHTISNLTVNGGDYTGLIGTIGDGADIKNFILDNTCSINGNAYCGVIGGTNGGGNVYITNVGNEGNVTGTAQNVCGILGVDMGGSATLYITNCYVTGAIKGAKESATVCGWSNGSSQIVNCWSTATLEGIYGTGSLTRGSAQVINCYEIEGVGQQSGVNKITEEDVKSGKFCYTFNQSVNQILLGQNLSEGQLHPTFADNTGYSEILYDEELGYYNPLPLKVKESAFENVTVEDSSIKSADVKGTFLLTAKADAITDLATASIMEAAEYEAKGAYAGKPLFGAVAKNDNISVESDGKVSITFTSYSTHTDQPIFEGELERKDVGDVSSDAKYVVVIYGGSLVVDGKVWKEDVVQEYTGANIISLVIDQAVKMAYGNDPTAINGISGNKNTEAYSITGVRVNKVQKGIYIIDGKKTAVK